MHWSARTNKTNDANASGTPRQLINLNSVSKTHIIGLGIREVNFVHNWHWFAIALGRKWPPPSEPRPPLKKKGHESGLVRAWIFRTWIRQHSCLKLVFLNPIRAWIRICSSCFQAIHVEDIWPVTVSMALKCLEPIFWGTGHYMSWFRAMMMHFKHLWAMYQQEYVWSKGTGETPSWKIMVRLDVQDPSSRNSRYHPKCFKYWIREMTTKRTHTTVIHVVDFR